MDFKSLFTEESDGERAVSPVIGVILMVAITVILAAVIATFVLGLGDQINSSASAGVSSDGGSVTVTSLGSNTDGVYCTGTDDRKNSGGKDVDPSNNNLAVVGDTISSCGGDNVVAIGSGDTQNATIRTNV